MSKIAVVFPGQGSQFVGMGQTLYDQSEYARSLFKQASDIMRADIAKICLEGPEETLKQTQYAQMGLFLVSAALYHSLAQTGLKPDYLAGHSLGELTAYYVSGVVNLEQAIRMVMIRGQYMQEAVAPIEGAMAAVLGLDMQAIQATIQAVGNQNIVVANDNCPGQVIISGLKEALEQIQEPLKQAGAKRVLPLNVAGPFHSPFMQAASNRYQTYLRSEIFQDAQIPLVLNRTAQVETKAAILKENLPLQIVSPVRWRETVEWLSAEVETFIECGPGSVLSGLIKKTNQDVSIQTINSIELVKERI